MVIEALIVSILTSLALVCLFMGLRPSPTQVNVLDRLELGSARPLSLDDAELSTPMVDRLIKPIFAQFLQFGYRLAPKRNLDKLKHDLVIAGNPRNLTVSQLLGLQVVLAIGVGALTLVLGRPLGGRLPILAIVLALLAYRMPMIWLKRQISARQKVLLRALPDALDMLTIAVHAGMGFDAALLKISEKWTNALGHEFNRTISEMRIGVSRREALMGLAWRCGIPDISTFVTVLIQADQLGLSIANVLDVQSEQLRMRRRQRAEEEARKAPLKMLFPLVLFIFPAMFAVILGPAVPGLIAVFGTIKR